MKNKHPDYMTTPRERVSYWTYFIGQNIYYNITAAFISTYLAMQGISLAKVAMVLLIVIALLILSVPSRKIVVISTIAYFLDFWRRIVNFLRIEITVAIIRIKNYKKYNYIALD